MFTKGLDCFVKGLSRRVVIVRPQENKIFEQAIFIIREGVTSGGVSADEVVREARRTADSVAHTSAKARGLRRYYPILFAAGGAGFTGLIWLITSLVCR